MTIILFHFVLFLLILQISTLCTCTPKKSVEEALAKADYAFWGSILSQSQSEDNIIFKALPYVSLKGCLKVGSPIDILTSNQCQVAFDFQTIYLVMGKFLQDVEQKILVIDQCDWKKEKDITPEQKYWLHNQPDKCPKISGKIVHNKCPDGSTPFVCKHNVVCHKKTWCSKAHSCQVNNCGGCKPQYFDKHGNHVCSDLEYCSDGNQLSTCYDDPCSIASVQHLKEQGCPYWTRATHCISSRCHGCHAIFIDNLGGVVCNNYSSQQCADPAPIHFGKCPKKILGYAFQSKSGKCLRIKGCQALGFPLLKHAKTCQSKCQCISIDNINFGECEKSLGWAIKHGVCSHIKGCIANKHAVKHNFFKKKKICHKLCGGNLKKIKEANTHESIINCPGDIKKGNYGIPIVEVEIPEGTPGAQVKYPVLATPESNVSLIEGKISGDVFPVGDTRVVWEAVEKTSKRESCIFIVRVKKVPNNQPVSISIPPITVTEGAPANVNISSYFSDPDGDQLLYWIDGLPMNSGLTIEYNKGIITGIPNFSDRTAPQPLQIRIMSSDGISGRTIQSFNLTIEPDPTNNPPVSTPIPDQTATAGQKFEKDLSSYFTDSDGDDLKYLIADVPFGTGLNLYDPAILKGVPTYADATAPQPLKIRIMANDGKSSVIETFHLRILPDPTNTPPSSSAISNKSVKEAVWFEEDLKPHFVDADGDELRYFVSGLPKITGIKVYDDGMLKGIPTLSGGALPLDFHVKVLATDGKASTVQTFILTILPQALYKDNGVSPAQVPASLENYPDASLKNISEASNIRILCPPYSAIFSGETDSGVIDVLVPPNSDVNHKYNIEYPLPISFPLDETDLDLIRGPEDNKFPIGDTPITFEAESSKTHLVSQCSFVIRLTRSSSVKAVEVLSAESPLMETAVVGEKFELDLTKDPFLASKPVNTPTYFVTGLPFGSGLSIDNLTGKLSGIPTISDVQPFPLTLVLSASLANGTNKYHILLLSITK